MFRTVLAVLVVTGSLLIATSAFGSATKKPVTLTGTVGPGFTITLKQGGKTVKHLKAGKYRFKISDKATIHNFALKGPVKKTITSVGFTGTKSVVINLKKGKYTYYCAPHASTMHGSFVVT